MFACEKCESVGMRKVCVCLCVCSCVFMLGIFLCECEAYGHICLCVCVCVVCACVCVRVQGVFMGTHLAHASVSMSHLDHRRKSGCGPLRTNKTQDVSINQQSRHSHFLIIIIVIIILIVILHRG